MRTVFWIRAHSASILVLASALWLVGCGDLPQSLVGSWRANATQAVSAGADLGATTPEGDVMLELTAEGKGEWRYAGETSPLSWEMRRDELLLHLPDGGLARGKLQNATLIVLSPGAWRFVFTRQ